MPSFRVNRRIFGAVSSFLAASVVLPVLHAQGRPEKTRVSIAVGGKSALHCLPLAIADQLGYFKAEGLDVEIINLPDPARALQAVTGGAADVCCGAYERTIYLQGKSPFYRAFVLMARTPQIAFGVSTRTVPDYKTPADLRDLKVGVTSMDTSASLVASVVLARGGLVSADVSYVPVGEGLGGVEALRSGAIDAISSADPVMTLLEQKGDVRIIADTRSLKGTQALFGGPMPAACLFAAQDFVQKNPNTVQALSNAVVRALKWLQTAGPGDMVKAVPEDTYLLGDRALFLTSFDKMRETISPDGMVPKDGPQTALRALASVDAQLRPVQIDLSKTYTNEFTRRSKDRFKV